MRKKVHTYAVNSAIMMIDFNIGGGHLVAMDEVSYMGFGGKGCVGINKVSYTYILDHNRRRV